MKRRSMLLLLVGAIAGGCSRDAPLVAPEADAVQAAAVPPVAIAATSELTAEAIDDALGRLVPALGDYGTTLNGVLLKLRANRSDQAARKELRRLVDFLDSILPAPYRADLDALRLELGLTAR